MPDAWIYRENDGAPRERERSQTFPSAQYDQAAHAARIAAKIPPTETIRRTPQPGVSPVVPRPAYQPPANRAPGPGRRGGGRTAAIATGAIAGIIAIGGITGIALRGHPSRESAALTANGTHPAAASSRSATHQPTATRQPGAAPRQPPSPAPRAASATTESTHPGSRKAVHHHATQRPSPSHATGVPTPHTHSPSPSPSPSVPTSPAAATYASQSTPAEAGTPPQDQASSSESPSPTLTPTPDSFCPDGAATCSATGVNAAN